MIYSDKGKNSTINTDTPPEKQQQFALTDTEAEELGRWALIIEDHYNKPMDFEWAKDGNNELLYIIQARPETIHSLRNPCNIKSYKITTQTAPLISGEAVGSAVTSGYARVLLHPDEAYKLQPGEILVTDITSPDWDPILKKVAGIITNKGGRTSHASIVARELGIVAIVGTGHATELIKDGDRISLSCAEGKTGHVYPGQIQWAETVTDVSTIQLPDMPKAQLIIGEPEKAFQLSFLPNHGVGLMRMEFIINNYVRVHPMAFIHPEKVENLAERDEIEKLTFTYNNKQQYFVDKLSQGVATIAAAFYPKEVIVRMSDFKTNEYASLLGGKNFEPKEENPMLGFRGASRYYNELYREGFMLECQAIKVVREDMGLDNVKVMIPFCRTVEEGKKVLETMESYGLKRGINGLQVYVMAEIPSNVLLADEFSDLFDGFSIGSNDLTQLTLGIDRDSSIIAGLFDEHNKASKMLIEMLITKAKSKNRKVGLCGQAPSDSAEFTAFLVNAGIDSISFNPDALLKGIDNINKIRSQL
jgi:pyruvate, water dikinase